jgi:hypothetical protein
MSGTGVIKEYGRGKEIVEYYLLVKKNIMNRGKNCGKR